MQQHYSEQLMMSNIAYAVGYSKQHFQRKFKEMYGINPHFYLQRLRLEKAAELLEQHPDISIQEVAAMIGIETNYFVRLFKKEYNITPAKYRAEFGK
ncbi:HTH-type transcriptional activator RhaS [compost metagenome]